MTAKEATARIKINKLLEAAGWRFFAGAAGSANVALERTVKVKAADLEALGEDFEKAGRGFVDFLLLDAKGSPLVVLEAKSEEKNPLVGKEQARKYAKGQNCRFVILSNGNLHYFWDLERGDPYLITAFPAPESVKGYSQTTPNPKRLIEEIIDADWIVLTQRPNYAAEAGWKNEAERGAYIRANKLAFLRPYQLRAVKAVQTATRQGKDRYLFEMATGTGKTLTAAAIIKLFLRTGNARRVLFLVDRLELEQQAVKSFKAYLAADFTAVIYKENRDDWRRAEIVVTTVQSLLSNNKYRDLFSPTDFDLVISDEAHRSIGGNARAVFDYFVGYKLGLTATPRAYLKNFDPGAGTTNDPRELERRLMLDTYRTFGCETGEPTFSYGLKDGVKEGYLLNPTVVDARTEVTTALLSKDGFIVAFRDDDGEEGQEAYRQRDFERKFVSEGTNEVFCRVFLERGLRDPISGEFGKGLVFAVSQNHAAKLTQILNRMAAALYPGKYQSDFAVQVTSLVPDAQQFTVNFANNNLLGSGNFLEVYKTSKARVCVTVGMMTTGYDCTDILNIGLFRPIFAVTDFVQIKGRGTRRHNFLDQVSDPTLRRSLGTQEKQGFKLFDFFANCEYFEKDFKYDEVLKLPKPAEPGSGTGEPRPTLDAWENLDPDRVTGIIENTVGPEGMKVDQLYVDKFRQAAARDELLRRAVLDREWDRAVDRARRELLNKPEEYFTLERLRKGLGIDRRVSLRELLEFAFGMIPRPKSKEELLEEEFAKFVADRKPEESEAIAALKRYFKAYITSDKTRAIIDSKRYTELATNSAFSLADFREVPKEYRGLIPEYIKDYVTLNQFLTE